MADIVPLRPGFARALPIRASGAHAFAPVFAGLGRLLLRWRSALDLRLLGDRQLHDIGLVRADVVPPLAAITTAYRRLWRL
jgi:uncharacterized protein YjiS (DUF1127 family)